MLLSQGLALADAASRWIASADGIAHVWNKYALPVFFITRAGMGFCVRPNRYALALATGSAVGADVFALHECDNPVCVRVSGSGAVCEHVVAGTQFDNMRRMVRARRGGGRPTIRGLGRVPEASCASTTRTAAGHLDA
jgi:hypothetical protein